MIPHVVWHGTIRIELSRWLAMEGLLLMAMGAGGARQRLIEVHFVRGRVTVHGVGIR